MRFFSKRIDKELAAYQQELIETHYHEVDNMYQQIRGWRHDYRNHIQTMNLCGHRKLGSSTATIWIYWTKI